MDLGLKAEGWIEGLGLRVEGFGFRVGVVRGTSTRASIRRLTG